MNKSRLPLIATAAVFVAAIIPASTVVASAGMAREAHVANPTATTLNITGPVILDEDIAELDDGAQSMLMLLQAHANLLGITEVAGNTWLEEGLAYALSQEELIGKHVPVYPGANVPLSGDRQNELAAEEQLYGPSDYVGAWSHPEPPSYLQLPQPPYGGYPTQKPASENAADFIIREAHAYPHQLTIIAAGPLTNIALAVRKDPTIVPLVKQMIYMCCAITVPGNTTPAAEFNVWFDPEAAKIALTAPWPEQVMIPLDLTNQVLYTKKQYDRIVTGPPTPIKKEFLALQGPQFAKNPNQTNYVYDEIATAIFLDPSLVKTETDQYVDVDTDFGLDFGRTLGYTGSSGPFGTQKVRVITTIDIPKFFDLYISLLTAS